MVINKIGFDVQTLLYAAAAIIIGFQAVTFAVLTKVFAINEGLLPEDQRLSKSFRYVTLEYGLIVGALLFLVGMGGLIYAVVFWEESSFGALDSSKTLRIIIPSVTALALGCQIILSAFFLSVLGLKRR